MKGLLLAGGHGTRLRPLTFAGNKHMIPIANRPMLHYALENFSRAGIREVGLVLGPIEEGIRETIGGGERFGLEITYIPQGEPKGLAHAVLCARSFLADDPFVMHLGDNLLQDGVGALLGRFESERPDAVICVTPVKDPRPYGVVELEGDRVVSIVEKPAVPRSPLALVGVYLLTPRIHPIIERLRPSARGELEITEALWRLHESGGHLSVQRIDGWWKDTGKPEDLLDANEFVLRSRRPGTTDLQGTVEPGARVGGTVSLGPGSTIERGAEVEGPVVIGAGARVGSGTRVGPATAIGDGVELAGCEVRRSIVMDGCRVLGPLRLENSILGRRVLLSSRRAFAEAASVILGDASVVTL